MEDLWPADIAETSLRTPLQILKEQAAMLAKRTGGLVEAEVTTTTGADGDLRHLFRLIAPVLNNYRYLLFQIYHGPTLYPTGIVYHGTRINVASDEELISQLRIIFSDDETRQIIAALIAQSRD